MKPAEIVSETIKAIVAAAKPGVNILELEALAEAKIKEYGATSATKNYHPKWSKVPYPSVICMGVNDVITHPIPKDYVLQNGDLLHIDFGIIKDGLAGDAGITVGIGEVSDKDQRLLRLSKKALYDGIKQVKAGAKVSDIGEAIERSARQNGYVVNRMYTGHGIGKNMHQPPSIPHIAPEPEEVQVGEKKWEYRFPDSPILKIGEIICIEPMLTYEDEFGVKDNDGWTVKTKDGKKSAFFEHMIKVTKDGYQILTTHFDEETNATKETKVKL